MRNERYADILSVFIEGNQSAICHIQNYRDWIRPISIWEANPKDRDLIAAFSGMTESCEEGDYFLVNGVGKDSEGKLLNPVSEILKDASRLPFVVVESRPALALEYLVQAMEKKDSLDMSQLANWKEIHTRLKQGKSLSVGAKALLQGLYECKFPVTKGMFFGVRFHVHTEEEGLRFARG